jgi:hypothetical protein
MSSNLASAPFASIVRKRLVCLFSSEVKHHSLLIRPRVSRGTSSKFVEDALAMQTRRLTPLKGSAG